MEKKDAGSKEKIILSKNIQREMIKFFLKTSMPKLDELDREKQQTSEIQKEGAD